MSDKLFYRAISPQYSSMAETMLKKLDNGGENCKTCDVHSVYEELEICLGDNERNWSKCQIPLKNFKSCFDSCLNNQKERTRSP